MLVPPVAAPIVIGPFPGVPPVCWTSPSVPLLMLDDRLLMSVVFCVTWLPRLVTVVFSALIASPTLL